MFEKLEDNRLLDLGNIALKIYLNNNNKICANQNKSGNLGSQKVSKVEITNFKLNK